jgi:asparagine synthase (glutamine-hydrolysing)
MPQLARGLRATLAKPLEAMRSSKHASLLEYGGTYGGAYLLTRSLFLPWQINRVLDRDMALEGLEQLQALEQLDRVAAQLPSPRLKVSALQMRWYMRNQLLRDSDWAGMAHGVEIRVPLVDIAFIQGLQPLLQGSQPPGKSTLAAAPSRPLPQEVVKRRKTGFSIPVDRWLPAIKKTRTHQPGLKDWAQFVYRNYNDMTA